MTDERRQRAVRALAEAVYPNDPANRRHGDYIARAIVSYLDANPAARADLAAWACEQTHATVTRLYATPDRLGIRLGQVWADNDARTRRRGERQHLAVVGLDNDKARLFDADTGKTTSVKVTRMRPTSTGYRLIRDAATQPDAVEEPEREFESLPIERVAIHAETDRCDGRCRPLHIRRVDGEPR